MCNYFINNDLLSISYYAKENNWKDISKTNYQRILYFSAVLSPIFIPDYKWKYDFSNTLFGPYNSDITEALKKLAIEELICISKRNISSNKVYENYKITNKGERLYLDKLAQINSEVNKYKWFKIIVKVLSIYGTPFLVKLVKSDPNIVFQYDMNIKEKLYIDSSENNLSKEFFIFLKENYKSKHNISMIDEDYLLLFFDVLYRKYTGGIANE